MHGYRYIIRVSIFGLILLEISHGAHYTDKWAVHIEGGERVARSLADKHGFIYLGQIMPDYYHLQHRKVAKRSVHTSSYYHRTLASEPHVKWLEQQVVKKRVKRDAQFKFNDPKWPRMWYLIRDDRDGNMNVRQAWAMGYSGKGVVVTILDDGIEKDHPDLRRNYDEQASYDVNGHDSDPQPRYDYSNENRHGTRCAGEVAAQADNMFCSVGVAYGASIGGVRMLDGDVTDSVEAQSLSLHIQHIQIYSASWGPDDDGRTVDGPATLARKAFYDGITMGRGGLGSIFVWASGNGGRDGDSCNCDGYTNSIYTLSISSATENGNIPWYSEACSSTLATTYSSGSGGERQIVTTDLRKGCTETHTGTSASAPLAAGLCALALEANNMLTWRDMQHIVVMTAKPNKLHASDWLTNGIRRRVSHSFGYGLMDAGAMVRLARNWTTVPPQHICEIRSQDNSKGIPQNGKIKVRLYTDGCEGTVNHVNYLEHVQARITLTASRRGEIQIFLTSPMGTRSTLLARRVRDTSREGFNNWAFMTTHSWGENAKGLWTLEIENGASISELKEWTLAVRGTAVHPQMHNITPPANNKRPFMCAGITSNGICIECRPGFYKLDDGCVASCPEYYYGTMETVPVNYNANDNTSTSRLVFQRHGVCQKCNVACCTCKGPSVEDCFQCNTGYEIRDGYCHQKLLLNFLDPDMLGFFVWVIVLCTCAVVLFAVVFGVLQARDHHILCWKEKRLFDRVKGNYNGINGEYSPEDGDSENEHSGGGNPSGSVKYNNGSASYRENHDQHL